MTLLMKRIVDGMYTWWNAIILQMLLVMWYLNDECISDIQFDEAAVGWKLSPAKVWIGWNVVLLKYCFDENGWLINWQQDEKAN